MRSRAAVRGYVSLAIAVLLAASVGGAVEADTGNGPGATISSRLQGIEEEARRLGDAEQTARRRNASPPQYLRDRIDGLRGELHALRPLLRGLQFRHADPLMRRIVALDWRLRNLESGLDIWKAREAPALRKSSLSGAGAITGTVTDATSGTPMAGVEISAVSDTGSWWWSETGPAGGYVFEELPDGTYFLYTYSLHHADELYDDLPCEPWCEPTTGTPVLVAGGHTTSGIDFDLSRLGSISGTVAEAGTGAPLAGVALEAYDANGGWVASTTTDTSGSYQIQDLAAGDHYVVARLDEYLDELYEDLPCERFECDVTSGTPIPVALGSDTPGTDFALSPAGSIAGIVATADGGTEWGTIYVYDAATGYVTYTGTEVGPYRVTDLAPGTYFVLASQFFDYEDELFEEIPCGLSCDPAEGTPVVVADGSETSGIDFTLDRLAVIQGIVRDSSTELPIADTEIVAYDDQGSWVSSGYSSTSGAYQISGLFTGTYHAVAYDARYLDELYDDVACDLECDVQAGTPIDVTVGSVTSGIDFALDLGGLIEGEVTAAATGAPLFADVSVFDADGTEIDWVPSDAQGRYAVWDLPSGSYFVTAEVYNEYFPELFQEIPCPSGCDPTTGTPVAVTAGSATTETDFTLSRLGRVEGLVIGEESGLPVTDAWISVFDTDGNSVAGTFPSEAGFYSLPLTPGSYYLLVTSSTHVDELFDDIPCEPWCEVTDGDLLNVALESATVADVALGRMGEISGRVTDAGTGAGLAGIEVTVVDADAGYIAAQIYTTSSGNYLAQGLQTGEYFVLARSYNFEPPFHLAKVYDDVLCHPECDPTLGSPIQVSIGELTTGIDLALPDSLFADVPGDHFAWRHVHGLYFSGITGGCAASPLRFCPGAALSRSAMTVFLLRGLEGPGYVPPPAQGIFEDVPVTSPFAPWIEELAARGITAGCSAAPPRFCPGAAVPRQQVAVFLLRAVEEPGYTPPPAQGLFHDVPLTSPFAPWVEEIYGRGWTGGCAYQPLRFCPALSVTRVQSAVFLGRAVGFPLP